MIGTTYLRVEPSTSRASAIVSVPRSARAATIRARAASSASDAK